MKILTVVIAAAALTGCGRFDPCEGATYCMDDVGVYVESAQPWMHAADTEQRIRRALDISASYWGSPSLAGVRVHFMDGNACGGAGGGCTTYYDPEGWTLSSDHYITKRVEFDVTQGVGLGHCVESTPLAHEVGHAVLGDPTHEDPRWAGQVALYFEQLAPGSLRPDCY